MHFLLLPALLLSGTCTINGPDGYTGPVTSSLSATCSGTVTPPVTPPPVTPPPTDASVCAVTQTSTGLPVTLTRQCSGSIGWGYLRPATSGAWVSADTIFGGTFGAYKLGGATMVPVIAQGSYMALAFNTGNSSGELHLSGNPTLGGGATVSISKTPGDFSPWSASNLCGAVDSGDLIAAAGSWRAYGLCNLDAKTTYFLNISPVHTNGASVPVIAEGISNY